MKIREVCKRTGLTERTVRFWVQQGLLSPETYEMNGRSYFVFSQADVAALEEIDTLRRAGFSLAQVQEMRSSPAGTAQAVETLLAQLRQRQEETARAVEALAAAGDCCSPGELAALLRSYAARQPLPEASPHFGRFDWETPQEKSRAYEEFRRSSARRSRRKRLLASFAAALGLAALSVVLTLGFCGQLHPGAPSEEAGWESRLSGDYDASVDATLPGFSCREGLDGATGRMSRVYALPAGEVLLSWQKLSPSEQELLEALEGAAAEQPRWQADPALGEGAALCYLPAGDGGVYLLRLRCPDRESLAGVLEALELRVEGSPVALSSAP